MADCTETLVAHTCETHGEFMGKLMKTAFGEFRSTCPTCDAEKIVAYAAQQAREEEEHIERLYATARLPKRYQSVGFKTFSADTESQKVALQIAEKFHREFIQALSEGRFLIFQGLPGTGKTHLACAVMRNLIHDGARCFYVSAIDAIRMLRESWRKDSASSEIDVLKRFESYDLLVLDEIGVQFATDAERVQLFDILNRRYAELRPTILITNLTVAEMQTTLGERIFDRFREVATVVTFDWKSYRGQR